MAVPIPAVSREGRTRDGQQLNVPAPVLEAMWKLTKGRANEPVGLGEGQYFVVRVDEVTPPAMPSLDSVRDMVTQAWIASENVRLLSTRSDALTERLRAGEDIAAVAASVGATVQTGTGLKQEEDTMARLGRGVMSGVFNGKSGQVFSQPQASDGVAIGRIDRISAPTAALVAEEAQQWRARIGAAAGDPFLSASVSAAAERMDATYNEELARQALGITEAPATPAGQ